MRDHSLKRIFRLVWWNFWFYACDQKLLLVTFYVKSYLSALLVKRGFKGVETGVTLGVTGEVFTGVAGGKVLFVIWNPALSWATVDSWGSNIAGDRNM